MNLRRYFNTFTISNLNKEKINDNYNKLFKFKKSKIIEVNKEKGLFNYILKNHSWPYIEKRKRYRSI